MTFTVIGILFYWCPVKRNKSINVDKNIFIYYCPIKIE